MAWCQDTDVDKRLESIAGKGWGTQDIPNRITRAENELKSKLSAAYGVSIVYGWDTTTPDVVKDMCADLAAIFLKIDYIDDYKLSDREKQFFEWIKDIVKGKAELVDNSGNIIARPTHRTKFNRGSKTPIFSMGNVGDDTWGDGTLDGFGTNQSCHEGDS